MSVRFGRYELLRPLGSGGMAEVFLARYVGPEGFEKRLVIKRVLPRLGSDRRLLRMFFEEARTQVSLSHGNLVPVFDFGRVGNDYFIAMEYVPGADLGTLLSATRAADERLPPSLVVHLGMEVCRGLAYVHRRGFVHRDVSPRNVLLSADGEVKLSDFGLALAAASEAAPGLRGTLAYISPEQARGERVDGRADLYSLGILIGESLLGQRLRVGAGDEAVLALARVGAPVRVEGPLGQVLARATQPSPDERFATAEEMLVALERAAAALGPGREAAVQELATRIAALTAPATRGEAAAPAAVTAPTADGAPGATADLRGGRRPDSPPPPESYFRDHRSASFVDEVLEPRPGGPWPRLRPAWLLAGVAGALVVGGIAVRAVRSPATPAPTAQVAAPPDATRPQRPPPDPPAPSPPPPAGPAPSVAVVQPARPATPSVPSRPPAPRPTRAAAVTETLVIHCTPWCIPSVDGRVRGQDGREHALPVSVGQHRVEVRRLDDRLERSVEIRPGQPSTLDFEFD